MKRCDECGGPFGLIVYRHFARRFCKKYCKDRYLARLRQRAAQAPKDRWLPGDRLYFSKSRESRESSWATKDIRPAAERLAVPTTAL